MNTYEKRKLIQDISKLDANAHKQIFEIILQSNLDIKFSSNPSTSFIDLALVDEDTLKEVASFVKLCKDNIRYKKEHERALKMAEKNVSSIYGNDADINKIEESHAIKISEEK